MGNRVEGTTEDAWQKGKKRKGNGEKRINSINGQKCGGLLAPSGRNICRKMSYP
jgi:hypothetical protein